jgi:hypothetical protein
MWCLFAMNVKPKSDYVWIDNRRLQQQVDVDDDTT